MVDNEYGFEISISVRYRNKLTD